MPPYPDIITCITEQGLSVPQESVYILQGLLDTNQFSGTPPGPVDVNYTSNINGVLYFDTSTGLIDPSISGGSCTTPDTTNPLTTLSDFPSYEFGGSSSTSTPSASVYSPTENEFLFVFGLFLFVGTLPFWERVLSVTRSRYDSWT